MNVKRLAAIAACVALSACTGTNTEKTNNGANVLELDRTYTLQGAIMDAVTGNRIGGSDLKVYLIQGTQVRNPDRLNVDGDANLVGEYAFANIPVDTGYGNKTYKVRVVKGGYLDFDGEISFTEITSTSTPVGTTLVYDRVVNVIGNIYMFPLGSAAADYKFQVTFNGRPVQGATVRFDATTRQPLVEVNTSPYSGDTINVINQTPGYQQQSALSAVTGADGRVTFPAASLALGVKYNVTVDPIVFEGTQLGLEDFGSYVVGTSQVDQIIAMSEIVPGSNKYGLYVTNVKPNSVDGQVESTGSLVITFSRPVELHQVTAATGRRVFGGTVVNAPLSGSAAACAADYCADASLSADGLTLTLTPRLTAGVFGPGSSITYDDGGARVAVKDYPTDEYSVFGLVTADGVALSNKAKVYFVSP